MQKKGKMKTNKSVAKRFKKTASGKFLRSKARRGHLMTSKNAKRKRAYRLKGAVEKTDSARLKVLLPYA